MCPALFSRSRLSNSFNPHTSPMTWVLLSHFAVGKTEVQRGKVTCLDLPLEKGRLQDASSVAVINQHRAQLRPSGWLCLRSHPLFSELIQNSDPVILFPI